VAGLSFQRGADASCEVQRAVIGCDEIHVTDFGGSCGAVWLG